jgi:signal transduction histidine kinase
MAKAASIGRDVKITLTVIGGHKPMPLYVESGLYRIAQEAVSNSLQHANPGHISLELTNIPDQVSLVIQDDGIGFDPDQIAADRFGLIGLNERAKLLNGSFQIQSHPGLGTVVRVEVPL